MKATHSASQTTMLLLSIMLGILLGTSLLLATKINHPPIVAMDRGLAHLLGEFVPEYELEKLEGGPISTYLYQGKSHLLVFTLPGCDACDTMYPILQKAAVDIPILMVANTREGLVEHAWAFPVAVDTLLLTMEHLNITNFPTALLVDGKQRIVEAVKGDGSIERIVQSAQTVIEKEQNP